MSARRQIKELTLETLKQEARTIEKRHKASGTRCSHSSCLEEASKEAGYQSYSAARASLKPNPKRLRNEVKLISRTALARWLYSESTENRSVVHIHCHGLNIEPLPLNLDFNRPSYVSLRDLASTLMSIDRGQNQYALDISKAGYG